MDSDLSVPPYVAVDSELSVPLKNHSGSNKLKFSRGRIDHIRSHLTESLKSRREFLPYSVRRCRQSHHLNELILEEFSLLRGRLRRYMDTFEGYRVEIDKIKRQPIPESDYTRQLLESNEKRAQCLYLKIYRVAQKICHFICKQNGMDWPPEDEIITQPRFCHKGKLCPLYEKLNKPEILITLSTLERELEVCAEVGGYDLTLKGTNFQFYSQINPRVLQKLEIRSTYCTRLRYLPGRHECVVLGVMVGKNSPKHYDTVIVSEKEPLKQADYILGWMGHTNLCGCE